MVVYVVERAIDPALSFPAGLNDIDMYIPSTAGYQAETNVVRLCNHLSHPTIAVHGADEDLAGCDFHSTSEERLGGLAGTGQLVEQRDDPLNPLTTLPQVPWLTAPSRSPSMK